VTKAVIYRPGSKSHIVAAFTSAIAIHLSAVALASLHHELPSVISADEFGEIQAIEPGTPQSLPPADEIQFAPSESNASSEFSEPEQPRQQILRTRPPVPFRPSGQTRLVATGNLKGLAIFAPRPEYSYEARSRHVTGSGVAVLSVNPSTGFVFNAIMSQSTGSGILDNSALSAFRRWRFKPGTASQIKIPITFLMTGAQY
jgi:TonB family protein